MKRGMLLLALLMWMITPVFAGNLIIKETETAIVVEYTGDATTSGKEKKLEDLPAYKHLQQIANRAPAVINEVNEKEHEQVKQTADRTSADSHLGDDKSPDELSSNEQHLENGSRTPEALKAEYDRKQETARKRAEKWKQFAADRKQQEEARVIPQ